MPELLIRLQKNIFLITVMGAVLLGWSFAYLGYVVMRAIIPTPVVRSAPTDPRAGRNSQQTAYVAVEPFLEVLTGAFFRGSGETVAQAESGVPGGGGEVELLGITWGHPSFANILVKEDNNEELEVYRWGATMNSGYKVVAIQRDSATLEIGGSRFQLKIGEKSGDVQQAAPSTNAGGDTAVASGENVQVVTIKRDRLQQVMKDEAELYKNKFAPITRNGRILGLKLMYVPPDNFLYQMGARTNDIIRQVNGQPIQNTGNMIRLWQSLNTLNKVVIDLERGGKIYTYQINIE
ncbi:MAG: hypothetical protein KDK30_10595 [Leptospiraceae bacterium]|nr:hypothetical protein [Leptospiraceae bacterium]MCB1314785.1 hypothetical protein [Leptospiraceae bacterium]MCB1322449.1 hypothetical protein [Leptospiraceae bacterium]